MSVGIVITGFFCGDYLEEAILSVKNQTDLNWTCCVLFDPAEHANNIEKLTGDDDRFILIQSEPINVCAARNRGYAEVDGELLFALDGDDLIEPQYISVLRQMMARQKIAIAYTGTRYFGDRNEIKTEYSYSSKLMATRNLIVSAAMIRRKDFCHVGGYDQQLSIGYEDWELWIAILKMGGEVAFEPLPLFHYRQHKYSRSMHISYESETKAKNYIFQKHRDFCWHSRP